MSTPPAMEGAGPIQGARCITPATITTASMAIKPAENFQTSATSTARNASPNQSSSREMGESCKVVISPLLTVGATLKLSCGFLKSSRSICF